MSGTTNSGGSSAVWKEQRFYASGTWTCPAPNTEYEVICIAPGGGSASGNYLDSVASTNGNAGTNGGNVSFGAIVTALGGSRGVYNAAQPTQGSQVGQRGVSRQLLRAAGTDTPFSPGGLGAPPIDGYGAGAPGGPGVTDWATI